MHSVDLTCDLNFTKCSDVDKAVNGALKMFRKRFHRKTTRLDGDSNSEAVYTYRGMTHDEVRILKKIVRAKAAKMHFKRVESAEHVSESDDNAKDKRRAQYSPPPASRARLDIVREMRDLCTRFAVLLDNLEEAPHLTPSL